MKEILVQGLDVTCNIDGLGIWTNGIFDEHLEVMDKVLQRLTSSNLKTTPLKCDWRLP